jgi:pSer/pThr/pTyr-binding forkhead associated (FHA) protein
MAGQITLRGMNGDFKGRIWTTNNDVVRIGRHVDREVVIDDNSVSRRHAEVRWTEQGWMIRDRGSSNGTRLNGLRIDEEWWPLQQMAVVQFGEISVVIDRLIEPTSLERLVAAKEPRERIAVEPRIILRGLNGAAKDKTWRGRWLLRVGSFAPVTVDLVDNSVSRYHAEVRYTEQRWSLEDLGSSTGTFLNGVRLGTGQHTLKQSDVIRVGAVEIVADVVRKPRMKGFVFSGGCHSAPENCASGLADAAVAKGSSCPPK